jgi:hypothetical protein
MTLRPLQTWFEKMSPRERFMLLAFAWAGVILWGFLLLNQVKTVRTSITQKQAQLKTQVETLNQKPKVLTEIGYYQDKFKTSVDGTELLSRVTNYYKASGMPTPGIHQIGNDSKKASIFNVNSVSVNFSHTPYRSLVDFTTRVEADKPYLIINEFVGTPDRTDPRFMTGEIRINSLQLNPGALDVSATPAAVR